MARGRNGRTRKARNGASSGYRPDQSGMQIARQVRDTHKFIRRHVTVIGDSTAGVGVGIGLNFQLGFLVNFAEFTALFDHYAIERVDLTVIPGVHPAQVYSMPDFDDAITPTGPLDFLERQNSNIKVVGSTGFQQLRVSIQPRVRVQVDSVVGTGTALGPPSMMIDAANTDVQHLGYKFWFAPVNSAQAAPFNGWSIIAAYHLKMAVAR